ncbi:unnamed protein product [Arctogadus glacialis]
MEGWDYEGALKDGERDGESEGAMENIGFIVLSFHLTVADCSIQVPWSHFLLSPTQLLNFISLSLSLPLSHSLSPSLPLSLSISLPLSAPSLFLYFMIHHSIH